MSRGRKWLIRGFALAAACAGLGAGLALAVVASKAEIEATKFTVLPQSANEEFARCGPGERALGGGVVPSGDTVAGGVRASGPLDSSGNTVETQSGDAPKQWYANVLL